MGRVNSNRIYEFTWKGKLQDDMMGGYSVVNFKLEVIPSDNELAFDRDTADVVKMSNVANPDIMIELSHGDLPIGLENVPALKLGFDVLRVGSDFQDLLKNPFRDYYEYVNDNVPSRILMSDTTLFGGGSYSYNKLPVNIGNIYHLYIDGALAFSGFQTTGTEGNFDDGVMEVEVWHCSAVIMQSINFNHQGNVDNFIREIDKGNLKSSQCIYNSYFYNTDNATIKHYISGATATIGKWFYFVKKEHFVRWLNVIYKYVGNQYFREDIISGEDNLPNFDNITNYKQDYTSDIDRGTALSESELYNLMYITDTDINGNFNTMQILDTWANHIEQYTNLWDFYFAWAKSSMVRSFCISKGMIFKKIIGESGEYFIELNGKDKDKANVNMGANVLGGCEASSIEKSAFDIDRIEVRKYGSRSQDSDNLTVIFNNNFNLLDSDISGIVGGVNNFAKMFKVKSFKNTIIARHFEPYFFKHYYFDIPKYDGPNNLTNSEVPISVNHNIKIDLGGGISSDDFTNKVLGNFLFSNLPYHLAINTFTGGLIDLSQRSGGSLFVYANSYVNLFSGLKNTFYEIQNKFDCSNKDVKYSGGSRGASIPLIVFRTSKFKYDTTAVNSFLDNGTGDFYLINGEIDLSCKNENGRKVIYDLTIGSCNYAQLS